MYEKKLRIMIVDKDGKVLLTLNNPYNSDGQLDWTLPNGLVDEDSDIIEAAKTIMAKKYNIQMISPEIFCIGEDIGLVSFDNDDLLELSVYKEIIGYRFYDMDRLPHNTEKRSIVIINNYIEGNRG